jgi:hypothetical protein
MTSNVSHDQFDVIAEYRQVYLKTPAGRRVLLDMLVGMGLFRSSADIEERLIEDPGQAKTLVCAIAILEQLGIWTPDNFPRLVEAMAGLPLPTITENQDGQA